MDFEMELTKSVHHPPKPLTPLGQFCSYCFGTDEGRISTEKAAIRCCNKKLFVCRQCIKEEGLVVCDGCNMFLCEDCVLYPSIEQNKFCVECVLNGGKSHLNVTPNQHFHSGRESWEFEMKEIENLDNFYPDTFLIDCKACCDLVKYYAGNKHVFEEGNADRHQASSPLNNYCVDCKSGDCIASRCYGQYSVCMYCDMKSKFCVSCNLCYCGDCLIKPSTKNDFYCAICIHRSLPKEEDDIISHTHPDRDFEAEFRQIMLGLTINPDNFDFECKACLKLVPYYAHNAHLLINVRKRKHSDSDSVKTKIQKTEEKGADKETEEKNDVVAEDPKDDVVAEDPKEDTKNDVVAEDPKDDVVAEDPKEDTKNDVVAEDPKDDVVAEDPKEDPKDDQRPEDQLNNVIPVVACN